MNSAYLWIAPKGTTYLPDVVHVSRRVKIALDSVTPHNQHTTSRQEAKNTTSKQDASERDTTTMVLQHAYKHFKRRLSVEGGTVE